jgi:hypothetical protein
MGPPLVSAVKHFAHGPARQHDDITVVSFGRMI